jgi:hypothetical protein
VEELRSLLDYFIDTFNRQDIASCGTSSDSENDFKVPVSVTLKRTTKSASKAGVLNNEGIFGCFGTRFCAVLENFFRHIGVCIECIFIQGYRNATTHHSEYLFNEIYYMGDFKLLKKVIVSFE